MSSMTRDEIADRLCTLAAEQAAMNKAEVAPSSHFVHDLNFDSLDKVEFVMELEDAFDLNIPDEQAEKVNTINDVVDLIVTLTREAARTA